MRYRTEIDGLRAVAVVPVILFHAGFELFSGGFVGVDVFFVISGYLITRIILSEMEDGKFSLINFYERRARRILPALFFVMLVCIPFAWMWLLSRDMKDFAESLVAASTFSSNILFWRESGYFDTATELKPLLHTWSLAVEEQYYILFPLFLMLTWRLGKRWILVMLAVVFMLSLGVGHWGAFNRPSAAFYLLPARGWEILIGAFLAFYLHKRTVDDKNNGINQSISLVGLLLVVCAVFVYDKQTPSPSFYTLLPAVGAALIILFAVKGTFVNALLSNKAFVGMGLISYSAYLWHQPLLAFAKYGLIATSEEFLIGALCLLTFPLAYLSWRYVEVPFRRRRALSRGFVFIALTAVAIFFISFGLNVYFNEGYPSRINEVAAQLESYSEDKNPFFDNCSSTPSKYLSPSNSCVIGDNRNIVGALLGDSHSDAVAYSLSKELENIGIGLRHMWYAGCPPVRGLYSINSPGNHLCDRYNEEVASILENDASLEYLVLVGRFTIYYEGDRFNNGEGGVERGEGSPVDGVAFKGALRPEEDRKETVRQAYINAVSAFLRYGKKVILIYPIPEQGWNVPYYAAKVAMHSAYKASLSTAYDVFLERNSVVIDILDSIGEHENLARFYPSKIFCDTFIALRCVGALAEKSFYYDDDHLSNYGASFLVKDIVKSIQALSIK